VYDSLEAMIYLILTASLFTNVPSAVYENRLARYQYAIEETLSYIPEWIQPVIVENTVASSHEMGKLTILDGLLCHGKTVPVLYTVNGKLNMRNKGVNEWLDIKELIDYYNMKDGDIIIKITGRYRLLSNWFLEHVHKTSREKDAWFRFMNVCTEKEELDDCILGCYASRVSILRYLSWSWINLFDSPEQAMAKYIRSSVSTNRLSEMKRLDIECVFSENGRVLCV
jgi:hypothetical protein